MVRSKSEVIIADILYKLGIPYVYEKKLKTREGAVYPDFTVRHPYEGNTYYLEHAGMLDKADYAADFCVTETPGSHILNIKRKVVLSPKRGADIVFTRKLLALLN